MKKIIILILIIIIILSCIFGYDNNVSQLDHVDTAKYIEQPEPVYKKYDRKDYKHWIDIDRDCQDTRQEVLIEEAFFPEKLIYKSFNKCDVIFGLWYCWFTGSFTSNPRLLDVDHIVPLKNAHESGAWKWDEKRKKRFANYLIRENHLMAVMASENRRKGSKGPDEYLPPNENFKPIYCELWADIKVYWGLTATQSELDTLKHYLKDIPGITYPKLRK